MSDPLIPILAQLEKLSPMPDDKTVTESQLDTYTALIDQLNQQEGIDHRVIRPLLASFGYGVGYGIYWGAVNIIERLERVMHFSRTRVSMLSRRSIYARHEACDEHLVSSCGYAQTRCKSA